MEKKSKVLPILISIPVSIIGYLIYYVVCGITVFALTLLSLTMHFDYAYVIALSWIVLIAESYCMIMILYRFHRATKGKTVRYTEGCLLLWICGILVYTTISKQELKMPAVLLINPDIGIAKDIRMMFACLIVFFLSSLLYKIEQKKKIEGIGWKINKGIFLFLLICLSCIVLAGIAFSIWFISGWQPING